MDEWPGYVKIPGRWQCTVHDPPCEFSLKTKEKWLKKHADMNDVSDSESLLRFFKSREESKKKKLVYVVGKNAHDHRQFSLNLAKLKRVDQPIPFEPPVNFKWRRAAQATFAWLIVAKRMFLSRDVARLIARMVYRTRDERVWKSKGDVELTHVLKRARFLESVKEDDMNKEDLVTIVKAYKLEHPEGLQVRVSGSRDQMMEQVKRVRDTEIPTEFDEEHMWKKMWPIYLRSMTEFRRENNLTLQQFLEIFGQRFKRRHRFLAYLYPSSRCLFPIKSDLISQEAFEFLKEFDTGEKRIRDVPPVSSKDHAMDRFETFKVEFAKLSCRDCFFDNSDAGLIVQYEYERYEDTDGIEALLRSNVLKDVQTKSISGYKSVKLCNPSRVATFPEATHWGTAFLFSEDFAVTAEHIFAEEDRRKISRVSWTHLFCPTSKRILTEAGPSTDAGRFHASFPELDIALLKIHSDPSIPFLTDSINQLRLDWGEPICELRVGMKVMKYGVTTGLTRGTVIDFSLKDVCVKTDHFGPFASKGDSGAVVFSADDNKVVGVVLNDAAPRFPGELSGHFVDVVKYERFKPHTDWVLQEQLDSDGDVVMGDSE